MSQKEILLLLGYIFEVNNRKAMGILVAKVIGDNESVLCFQWREKPCYVRGLRKSVLDAVPV